MKRLPQIGWLADGRRIHLHDGPIDLIVEARGTGANVRAAYDAAVVRFTGLLDELCDELSELRKPARPATSSLKGGVARRMYHAVAPFAADHFITPMAAVAGAVAEEILGAMVQASDLDRAYVNNGGDIALHLADGGCFAVGLIDRPDMPGLIGKTIVESKDSTRGIATSGWRGRSFSLGRFWRELPRKLMLRRPLSPTRSICRNILLSSATRRMTFSRTAIWERIWSRAVSVSCHCTTLLQHSMRELMPPVRFSDPD